MTQQTPSYLFAGDNSCLIKLWNDCMDLVSLDWLNENYDVNTKIWSVKKEKFVPIPDLIAVNDSLVQKLPVTRLRCIDGLVDVIDTNPDMCFTHSIWSHERDLVNPMSSREGDLPNAYLLGLFFVLGEIIEVNDKFQIMMETHKIETILDFKFTLKNIYPSLNIPSTQVKSGSKWTFLTLLDDAQSSQLASYWYHIFYIENVAQTDLGIKRIPKGILNSSLRSKKEFLRGYLDAQDDCILGQIFTCESKVVCAQLYYLYKCLAMPVAIQEINTPLLNNYTVQLIPKGVKYNGVVWRQSLNLRNQPSFYQILNRDKFTLGIGDGLVL